MLAALRRHLGGEPGEGGLGQLTGEPTEKSRDAGPGRQVPLGLVLVLVLLLVHVDVDQLEHSCDVLGSRGLEGSGLALNFCLRWGCQEEGFCRDYDIGLGPRGNRHRIGGCRSEMVNMLMALRRNLGRELDEGGPG